VLYQLSLATFPGLGIALFALAWAALVATRSWRGPAATVLYGSSWLGICLGIALFLWAAKAAVSGPCKGRARFSIAYTVVLIILLCWFCEVWLPVSPQTHEQWTAEQLVRRRNQENTAGFRGTLLWPGKANDVGWLDRTHAEKPTGRRVVFIGDSMLEIRSRRRLALRVEDLFARAKEPIEVVNLSMCGADPLDYRLWLNEFALDYHPSEIFIFMYGPNDFNLTLPHRPYHSPPLRVNGKTVKAAQETGLAPEVVQSLRRLARKGEIYRSRQALETALECPLPFEKYHVVYNLVLAHSDAIRAKFPTSIHERILNTGRALVDRSAQFLAASGLAASQTNVDWWMTGEFVGRYDAIYLKPRETRLRALCELFADFMKMSPEPIMQMLQGQGKEFVDYLIEQPDMTWYLAQPLNRLAGLGEPDRPTAPDPAGSIQYYTKLFHEMEATANAHGAKLTFVFIPAPALTDPDFKRFWGDIITIGRSAPTCQEILKKLPEGLRYVNLGQYNDRLQGKYWKFDAHWTDEGNDIVADILADYLRGNSR